MSERQEIVDLLVIGAGPTGMACAIEAQRAGFTAILVDKGCLCNSLFHYPSNMTFFTTPELLEIGDIPFTSPNQKPNRSEALEYYRRVCASENLEVRLYEKVESVTKEEHVFHLTTSKGKYKAKAIILALGFYDLPYLLHVPGEELSKVRHYYDEPHPYYAQRVVVVGAANSAVDAALETWRKGAEVTMVIREASLRDTVKYWVKPDIENRISEGSIRAYFNSTIKEITPHAVSIITPEGERIIENDFVLAMTGYQPPFGFLKSIGIGIQNDVANTPVYNEQTMETNIPNVYLAGVVCGGLRTGKWFIENSRVHAVMIIEHLIKK